MRRYLLIAGMGEAGPGSSDWVDSFDTEKEALTYFEQNFNQTYYWYEIVDLEDWKPCP